MNNKLMNLAIGTALIGTLAIGGHASAEQVEVKKGDSLWHIANEYGMTVNELREVNDLKSNVLQPKQILETTDVDVEKETKYIVKSGDTLSAIGLEFDVKINELKEWNELTSDLIIVNQELLIKGAQVNQTSEKREEKVVEKQTEVQEEKEVEVASETEVVKEETTQNSGQQMTMKATAYTAECEGCTGVTATGINLNADRNAKVIAVDPSVIPLGSRVYVEGYGEAIAGDTGGAIKGNRIDLHMPTKEAAYQFGVRTVNITVLN